MTVGSGEGVGVGVGVTAHELKGELVLRGAGAEVWKSAALSSASVQPSFCLSAEVALPGACAAPVPSKQLAFEP